MRVHKEIRQRAVEERAARDREQKSDSSGATPVADSNLVASKPTNTLTGPHKAKMVTTTYTVVLLQIAIMLEPIVCCRTQRRMKNVRGRVLVSTSMPAN